MDIQLNTEQKEQLIKICTDFYVKYQNLLAEKDYYTFHLNSNHENDDKIKDFESKITFCKNLIPRQIIEFFGNVIQKDIKDNQRI